MEVAALGLKIDGVQDVVKAGDALDDFAKSAQKADKANEGLTKSTDRGKSSKDKFTQSSDQAAKGTKQFGKDAEDAAKKAKLLGDDASYTSGLMSELSKAAFSAGGIIGAAFSINALKNYADGWSDMQSQVGAATGDMAGAADMMTRLVDIANASYAPLEQTASTYASNVGVLRSLGKTAQEAADYTESLNHMLVLTATRGQQAESVQNALSKAMAVGKLTGEGLESVLANGGEVAQALANELGTTVSGLRQFATEGKITNQVIANAIIKPLDEVAARAAEMPATLSDAFTRINNNLTEFVGRIDKATGASSAIADVVLGFADGIRAAGTVLINFGSVVSNALQPLSGLFGYLADQTDTLLAALAGFAAPAIAAGIWGVSTALISGMAAALKIVWALMLANPVGVFIAALAALGVAAYKMRDTIKEVFGVDIVQAARDAANFVIRDFAAAFENIKFVWNNFGSMMGAAVIGGVNAAITAINGLISGAIQGVNTLIESLNKIPGLSIGLIDTGPAIELMANTYAENMTAALAERNTAINAIMETDYIEGMINFGKSLTEVKTGADDAAGGVNNLATANNALAASQNDALKSLNEKLAAERQYLALLSEHGEAARSMTDVQREIAKLEIEVANATDKQTKAYKQKLLTVNKDINAAQMAIKSDHERLDLMKEFARVREESTKREYENLTAIQKQVKEQEEANKRIGLTTAQLGALEIAKLRDEAATKRRTAAEMAGDPAAQRQVELLRQQAAELENLAVLKQQGGIQQANQDVQDLIKSDWDKTSRTIGQTLQDYIMGGGKDAAQYLKRLFSTLILEPIVNYGMQGLMGMLGGGGGVPGAAGGQGGGGFFSGLSNAGGGFTNWGGWGGNLSSGIGNLGNSIGGGLGESLVSLGSTVSEFDAWLSKVPGFEGGLGSVAGYATAIFSAFNGDYFSALGAAIGTYFFPGIGTMIGSWLGGLLDGLDGSGDIHEGATGYFNTQAGAGSYQSGPNPYNAGVGDAMQSIATGIGASFGAFLNSFGLDSNVDVRTNWLDDFDGEGGSWGNFSIAIQNAKGEWEDLVNWATDSWDSKWAPREFDPMEQGIEQYMEAVAQSYVEALKQVDLPSWAQDVLGQIGDDAAIEDISATLNQLSVMRAALSSWQSQLAEFSSVGDAAFGALLESMGGFENLSAGVSSFVDLYYSEQEKLEMQQKQLTDQLAKMNVELPASKDAWRELVDSALAAGEGGAELAALLLSLGPAFAQYADNAEAAAQAQIDAQQAVIDALYSDAGISGDTIAQILRDGMLGRLTQEDVGAQLSTHIIDGIYNSIAGGFAQQITDTFTSGIITPLLQAAATGSAMSGAVSQASIDAVVAQAHASIAALQAILNDPALQAAIADINSTIKDLNVGAVAVPKAVSRPSYSGGYSGGSSIKSQSNEMINAWKSVYDAILGSMKSLRDTILGTTEDSGAGFYEAQFAMLTAQARAGDQKAAEKLPDLVDKLAAYAKENSASLYDQNAALAGYLASLEETNRYVAGLYQKSGGKVANLESLTTPVTYAAAGTKATPGSVVSAINMTGMGSTFNDNAAMMAEWRAIRDQLQLIRESNEDIATSARGIDRNVSDVTNQGEYVNVNVIEVETTA